MTQRTTHNLQLTTEQSNHLQSGIIKELSPAEFTVWITIQAYIHDNVKQPSQQELADLTGITRATIGKAINSLLEKSFNNIPFLERVKVGNHFQQSHYKIPDIGIDPTVSQKTWTAKTFISRFCQQYTETFGVNYNPTWGKDIGMVNRKFIQKFTDEELEGMVTTAVTQYTKRWGNNSYPRPTLGQLCTWLGNSALTEWQLEKQKEERWETVADEIDLDRFAEQGGI